MGKRFLVWESNVYDPKIIFENIPSDLISSYQYFNIPAEFNETQWNPLNVLKSIKEKEGDIFTVLKLDTDTPNQWNIMEMMLREPEIVDEFFVEHEVGLPMMGY